MSLTIFSELPIITFAIMSITPKMLNILFARFTVVAVLQAEMAALEGCKCMELCHLGPELGDGDNEVCALQSDHCSEVSLSYHNPASYHLRST